MPSGWAIFRENPFFGDPVLANSESRALKVWKESRSMDVHGGEFKKELLLEIAGYDELHDRPILGVLLKKGALVFIEMIPGDDEICEGIFESPGRSIGREEGCLLTGLAPVYPRGFQNSGNAVVALEKGRSEVCVVSKLGEKELRVLRQAMGELFGA